MSLKNIYISSFKFDVGFKSDVVKKQNPAHFYHRPQMKYTRSTISKVLHIAIIRKVNLNSGLGA